MKTSSQSKSVSHTSQPRPAGWWALIKDGPVLHVWWEGVAVIELSIELCGLLVSKVMARALKDGVWCICLHTGTPFPKQFVPICKKILTRLYRVFVHVYIHHFDKVVSIGAVGGQPPPHLSCDHHVLIVCGCIGGPCQLVLQAFLFLCDGV